MAMRTAVCTAIGFFLFTCLRIAGKYDLIVSIYGIIFKESKNKINLFICPDDGMHHILQGAVPSFFFRLIALVQPGDRLIHPFFRKGKDGAFFFLIRGLLKAPGLRVHPDGEGCAVFPVIAVHQVAHAVMAAGEGLFLQSPVRDKSFIDHIS